LSRRPRPLGAALAGLRSRLAPATLLADVQARWPQAAGEEVARHAEPVAERAGVVTIRCESAVWASELAMMSTRLLEQLNEGRAEAAPELRELRFTVTG
jgi:predicted nucleic acid-binding Zn ribbon protein